MAAVLISFFTLYAQPGPPLMHPFPTAPHPPPRPTPRQPSPSHRTLQPPSPRAFSRGFASATPTPPILFFCQHRLLIKTCRSECFSPKGYVCSRSKTAFSGGIPTYSPSASHIVTYRSVVDGHRKSFLSKFNENIANNVFQTVTTREKLQIDSAPCPPCFIHNPFLSAPQTVTLLPCFGPHPSRATLHQRRSGQLR